MLHEFALDPSVIFDRFRRRFFFAQLGVEHGRLIAEIPKLNRWQRSVWDAARAADLSEVEMKRLEIDLLSAREKACVRNVRHPYDGNHSWLENAEANSGALRAIVADGNPHGNDKVLAADEVDEVTPLWQVDRHAEIDRDGRSLAEVCAPLFEISYRLKLVDPNFDPTGPRWLRGLAALLRTFEARRRRDAPGSGGALVELHVSSKARDGSAEEWGGAAARLSEVVPSGLSLTLVRWGEAEDGTRMHARYVLTERGGLEVNYGLDAPGHGTTHVTLLDGGFRDKAWRDFSKASSRLAFVDEVVVVGKRD